MQLKSEPHSCIFACMSGIKIIECPRDAMQGWPHFIPTEDKIAYINALLKVGFDTIDFGSFVSHQAIPQMADTKDVLSNLETGISKTGLLAIVANVRGAREAAAYDAIQYLGFPFSLSPTFQLLNTNSTIEESLKTVDEIQNICTAHNKELVIYLSMGFGNPYGDAYNEALLLTTAREMVQRGIKIISLSDTVGLASPQQIDFALSALIPAYPSAEFGVHLHSAKDGRLQKLEAALKAGCKRFDGAINGIGGCPMAQSDLVGNMDTLFLIEHLEEEDAVQNLNKHALEQSIQLANKIFV